MLVGAGLAIFCSVALIAYKVGQSQAPEDDEEDREVKAGELEDSVPQRQTSLRKQSTLTEKSMATDQQSTAQQEDADADLTKVTDHVYDNGARYTGQMKDGQRWG